MEDKVRYLPGVVPQEELTFEKVLEQIKEHKISKGIIVAQVDDDKFLVTGNTSMSYGVYLMELGKQVIMNESE